MCALPIKPTPTLYGKDAEAFLANVKKGENTKSKPLPTPKATEALSEILKDAGIEVDRKDLPGET